MRLSERFHILVAALIAVAVPIAVFVVNGFLPFPAIVAGIVMGLTYWCLRTFPMI